jgi:hypothetical protein
MSKPKIAIGCIVQWYEVEMYSEYLQSVINAIKYSNSYDNVFVDFNFYLSENIEQVDTDIISKEEILNKFKLGEQLLIENGINYKITYYTDDKIYTIADYRREFNDVYCQTSDVLMWGESDALIPKETFQVLETLHLSSVSNGLRKYVAFFGTNKMWDDSWLPVEYSKATDKPFLGKEDNKNWWGVSYVTELEELYQINGDITELEINYVSPYKFNGCGLIVSSDVVKSGVNIPRSIMLVHEDTAFQNSIIRFFQNNIPQYIIKNVYLAHNRRHSKKRLYVKGEQTINDISKRRESNQWYNKVWKIDHLQAHNAWGQHEILNWKDVFN